MYNSEGWSDPGKLLRQVKEEFASSKKDADTLRKKIDSLFDSTSSGSKWNIEQSIEKSNNASKKLLMIENKFEKELKPKGIEMTSAVEVAEKYLKKYEDDKKEAIELTLSQLNSAFKSVSSLNAAVCGAETSEEKLCDSKCGGAGCKHCGSNVSTCSGLADSHYDFVTSKQKFDDRYNKIESSLKETLIKVAIKNMKLKEK